MIQYGLRLPSDQLVGRTSSAFFARASLRAAHIPQRRRGNQGRRPYEWPSATKTDRANSTSRIAHGKNVSFVAKIAAPDVRLPPTSFATEEMRLLTSARR